MSDLGADATVMGWRDRLQARLAGPMRRRLARTRVVDVPLSGDAERGRAMLAGRFAFANAQVETTPGTSIWAAAGAVSGFEAARQGFGWLDDLAALGTGSARAVARSWVAEWLNAQGNGRGPGWTLPLASMRLGRLLAHADWLIEAPGGLSPGRLERAFARHQRFALRRIGALPGGAPGLAIAARLVVAGCALDGSVRLIDAAQGTLERLSAMLIAQDGAVADRSPETLAGMFCDLAEAAAALRDADRAPGVEHARALARAAPVLRALRHAGGGLARFHGGGRGEPARLDAAFALALPETGARAAPPFLPMGYARLARGRVTVIADAAAPPGGAAAEGAHASTLAFEMSAGRHPLVVNCGAGTAFGPDWRRAARGTASHSTLAVDTGRPTRSGAGPGDGEHGGVYDRAFDRAEDVEVDFFPDQSVAQLVAAHNGYVGDYGLIHVRRLDLSLEGGTLRGEDLLSAVTAAEKRRFAQVRPTAGLTFAVRFHLHPDCAADLDPVREEVAIRQPGGTLWWFRHTSGCAIRLDPSVYLENTRAGPVPCLQIVLDGIAVQHATSVGWSLTRDPGSPAFRRESPRGDDANDQNAEAP